MSPTAKELNAWVMTVFLLVVYAGYAADASGAVTAGSVLSLVFRSTLYLVTGLIVVLSAVRLFRRPEREDERDRLIALRAQRNAYFVAMAGIFLVFSALMAGEIGVQPVWPGMPPVAAAMHLLLLTMVAAELTNQVSRIVAYRRSS